MNLIGYLRVSTGNQKEEGTIELQKVALNEYSVRNGHSMNELFCDEGVSGGLENRPALSAMFDRLENDLAVEGVLIFKLDRLARDLYIQEHLIKKLEKLNKKLISIKEPNLDSNDPMRKAFRQFMGIVSELEKAFITMRMSGGRISKAKKGGYAGGGVPLGYKVIDNDLVIDENKVERVKQIFYLKRYKRMSLRAIALYMNENGFLTSRGNRFYASTVKYILNNEIYRGLLSYSSESVKRSDLALI